MPTKLILASLVLLFAFVACGRPDTGREAAAPTAATPSTIPAQLPTAGTTPLVSATAVATVPTIQRTFDDNYVFVHSLKERVAKSTLIVVGEVLDTGEVINLSRDVTDRTKPATDSFGVGQVYQVNATRYLKGTDTDTLNIINLEGFLPKANPATVTQVEIAQAKAAAAYPPLQIGQTYVFFLEPFTGVDFKGTYFIGSLGYPWRFKLAPDSTMVAEGPTGPIFGPEPDFAPQPLADLLPQVEQLVQAEKDSAPTK